jgi:hypothetical protein
MEDFKIMAIGFQKAKREKIWIKILLGGASGSGKTYSALRLASGLASQYDGRFAAIDTENGRIKYYADEFDFDDLQLDEPYTPEKYIEAIDMAIDGGYKVLIIDSTTHEWKYVNDVHDKMPGNSFTNWGKVKPRHNSFMEKLLQSPIHLIATTRGKDEYTMEEKNGKQVPKKVGLGMQQEKDIEYNYTATFNIAQDTHIAEVMKDNTHLFEGRYEMLTEKDGKKLFDWANSGVTPIKQPQTDTPKEEPVEDIKTVKTQVTTLAKEKSSISNEVKTSVKEILAKYHPSGNPNKIDDITKLKELLNELKNINVEDK